MADRFTPRTTTDAGIPVQSDEFSLSVGSDGPIVLNDHYLLEQMANFNREQIPERQPHAKGSGAFGRFEVTADVSRFTKGKVFQPGARTDVAARFSTVAGERGSPDTWRDPRGFSVKFYTEEGNFDMVGNFIQRASASLIGTVDAGEGNDLFIVDATGGGAVNDDQFVNFERFSRIGQGNVAYSGAFRFNTVGVMGGTVTVAAGQTLATDGPVTVTGSGAAETVVNDGTIAGNVSLGGGNDRVVNRGAIGGLVLLGDGDDGFVEGPGSRVTGGVDGGAGTDTYTALLAGDRAGLGARTGFERLGVDGTGTPTLTLDQSFEAVSLAGTGLNATLNGFTLGRVTGSDAAGRLVVDGDVA